MASSSKTDPYKVLLPQTSFPMKARLVEKEPTWIQFWKEKNIYHKLMQKQKKSPAFYLLDGPPYANGKLHIGHALNKILKDIVIKYKNLSGCYAPFIPVWDCHGLPIEVKALKKTKEASPAQIRKLCRKEAHHWVQVQSEQFQQLGVFADWQNPLLTMDADYEALTLKAVAQIAGRGLIYRGKKPIHWCCKLKTAIASSEVEYRKHKSLSIYVKFPVPELKTKWSLNKDCFFAIWTTTPWTLPANQGICLKASLTYGLFQTPQEEYLVLAKNLKSHLENKTGLSLKPVKFFKGKELEHLKARHPFRNQNSVVVLGDHVSEAEGTGCVHTAPGHGMEDFLVGQKYGLKTLVPVDGRGVFTEEAGEFCGQHIFKANPLIVKKLQDINSLLAQTEIEHNYPFSPRSSYPLIFRATDQWFISFDHKQYSVRKKSLSTVHKDSPVQFYPEWGRQRLKAMLLNSPDWCLSRQRHWGVPVPVFYCVKCKTPLLSQKITEGIANKMESSGQGIEYWFSTKTEELLPSGTQCLNCKHSSFEKGQDILDVWFDSGICHFVFQKKRGWFPADLYIEGSDQHRGWFQTSLNSSVCLTGQSPFKALLTHCFVNDGEGRKMSKSQGNALSLDRLLKEKGAEMVRLWVASEDYSQDLHISQEIFNRLTEAYRSFRNTIRFMLGNLYDFNPETDLTDLKKMHTMDQWMMSRLSDLVSQNQKHYQNFQFHKIYQSLNTFFKVELSSLYLDILKDRLYTFKSTSGGRRSAQSAIYLLLTHLLKLMSPITTFLSEEAYQHLPGCKKESIFLEDFPAPPTHWFNKDLEQIFDQILKIREKAFIQMEEMRRASVIGSSLGTCVHLSLPQALYKSLNPLKLECKEFLVVSDLQMECGSSLKITVTKAKGLKCKRCWHISKNLNKEQICQKCLTHID